MRWTRAARASAPTAVTERTLGGSSAQETDAALKEVDVQNKQLAADLKDYVARFGAAFPELRHVLADAGLSVER